MNIDEMLSHYEEILEPIFIRFDMQEVQTYLSKFSPGYGYIQAIFHVHSMICGEGVSGFYSSSAWPLIWPAMNGAYALGLPELGDCLKSIIYYYHRTGRSKLKRNIPKDYFEGFSIDPSHKPDDWSGAYYDLYRHINSNSSGWVPRDLLPKVMESHSELFEREKFMVNPIADAKYCYISKNITRNNKRINTCMRFKVAEDKLSGWQFYAEIETDKQINDPDHMRMCSLNVATIFEPQILEFYNEDSGSEITYERDESGLLVRVYD